MVQIEQVNAAENAEYGERDLEEMGPDEPLDSPKLEEKILELNQRPKAHQDKLQEPPSEAAKPVEQAQPPKTNKKKRGHRGKSALPKAQDALKKLGDQMAYDTEKDEWICPAGKRLASATAFIPKLRMATGERRCNEAEDCTGCRRNPHSARKPNIRSGTITLQSLPENAAGDILENEFDPPAFGPSNYGKRSTSSVG